MLKTAQERSLSVYLFLKKYPFFSLCAAVLFLAFFSGRYGILDWEKEIYFNSVIKDSLIKEGSLPAFVWSVPESLSHYPVFKATSVFWAIPETMLFSPLSWTLYFVDPIRFQHLHAIIFLLMGFWGFLSLSKRLRWSREQSLIFEAGVFLSPMMIQHMAVGYSPWIALYLIPSIFYFYLHHSFKYAVFGLASILVASLLIGGMHPFVLFSALLLCLSFFQSLLSKDYRIFSKIILSILICLVVSLGRLYPSMLAFETFKQELLTGYSLRKFLLYALTPPFLWGSTSRQFLEAIADNVASWDGGVFWGPILLLWFFLRWPKNNYEKALLLSSVFLAMISFYDVWASLLSLLPKSLSAKLVSAEKYPYRWMQMAYFLFLYLIVSTEKSWSVKLPSFLHKYRVLIISLPLCWAFLSWSSILMTHPNKSLKLPKLSYQKLRSSDLGTFHQMSLQSRPTEQEKKFLVKKDLFQEQVIYEFNARAWVFLRNLMWGLFVLMLLLLLKFKGEVKN